MEGCLYDASQWFNDLAGCLVVRLSDVRRGVPVLVVGRDFSVIVFVSRDQTTPFSSRPLSCKDRFESSLAHLILNTDFGPGFFLPIVSKLLCYRVTRDLDFVKHTVMSKCAQTKTQGNENQ